MEALRAVFAKLGFDIETEKVLGASKAFDQLVGKLASFGVMAKAASMAYGLVKEQINAGTEIKLLADQLGMTTQEVQKYKYAADMAGLSTHQMVTAFKILANHMGAGTTLTGMAHAMKQFGQYGLSAADSTGKMKELPVMLGDIADKMKSFGNAAQRVRFANEMMGEMGFRLIPMLIHGREAVEELFKDFDRLNLTMSDKFVGAAYLTNQKLKMLKTAFNVFKSEIAMGILPKVQAQAARLTDLSSRATNFARHTTWMTTAWMTFGAMGLVALLRLTGGLRMLFGVFFRFMIPLAILGLIYLVFDDIYALVTGKKSLIGEFLEEFMGAEAAADFTRELRDAQKQVGVALKEALPAMKDVGKVLLKVLPIALTGVTVLLGGLVDTVGWLHEKLDEIFNLTDRRANANAIYDRAIADGKGETEAQGAKNNYLINARMKAKNQMYDMKFVEGQGSNGIGTRHNEPDMSKYSGRGGKTDVKQTNHITVRVAGNASKETASEIGTKTREAMREQFFNDDLGDASAQTGLPGGM